MCERREALMSLVCPHCGRSLEFTGERPSFCGYCGQRLPWDGLAIRPTAATDPGVEATAVHTSRTLPFPAPSVEDWPTAGQGFPGAVGGYRLLRPLGAGGM